MRCARAARMGEQAGTASFFGSRWLRYVRRAGRVSSSRRWSGWRARVTRVRRRGVTGCLFAWYSGALHRAPAVPLRLDQRTPPCGPREAAACPRDPLAAGRAEDGATSTRQQAHRRARSTRRHAHRRAWSAGSWPPRPAVQRSWPRFGPATPPPAPLSPRPARPLDPPASCAARVRGTLGVQGFRGILAFFLY